MATTQRWILVLTILIVYLTFKFQLEVATWLSAK